MNPQEQIEKVYNMKFESLRWRPVKDDPPPAGTEVEAATIQLGKMETLRLIYNGRRWRYPGSKRGVTVDPTHWRPIVLQQVSEQ